MALELYKKKRNFKESPEPTGATSKKTDKLIFVIQRHKASHLHYDFRLELDGVLKSWAVPKGPSMNAGDKRLAMMVEDHPYDYKDFAGVIPSGYGAGIVEIWDKGTYTDLEESDHATAVKNLRAGLKSGNLKIKMKGKKLKGEFALVKLKGKGENSWLLLKHKDEFAVAEDYNAEDMTPANSPINKWLKENGKNTKSRSTSKKNVPEPVVEAKPSTRKLSDYIPAMLAKETSKSFSSADWLYEIKWDGYRAIAELNKDDVKLYSRNGNSFLSAYPLVVNELRKLKLNAILDGEIVVLNEEGNPDFQKLQHYAENTQYPIHYYVFDLLEVNGEKLYDLPLIERKQRLEKLLKKSDVVKYSDHVLEEGEPFFEAAQAKDLEGIMAKKIDSQYYPGKRTNEWLKIKHHKSDEAIICGFTSPRGGRKYFGALVLGMMINGKLTYVGHTGSGFDQKGLKEMSALLEPLIQEESPFDERIKTNQPVTWVKPKLVCELKFTEMTSDGKMRHPIFLRLREDKKAEEVTSDKPTPEPMKKAKAASTSKTLRSKKEKVIDVKDDSKDVVENNNDKILTYGKIQVKTTNRQKIFFPDESVTKGDVIDYYIQMADFILPYLKDRPQSLLRTPNGINGPGFFQKDAGPEAPEWVKSIVIPSESSKKGEVDYILCNNLATLTYLNNLGCIEINPWHSTIKNLDKPDYMIIDIDPSENNTFDDVIEAALVVKDVLDKAGAYSVCKTSGATGLHVYVPMGKKYTYEQVKDFAYLICMLASEQLPETTTLERSLSKRSKSQIYMDYLQNRRGQTIASVYSLRPKKGATVSTPLTWKEVKPGLSPLDFNIKTVPQRLIKTGDIFSDIFINAVDMGKCLKNLEQ
ncbi:MAG TPA: DNA ligase D [Segetibacter sp.]|jgi:bifunctional non-homologous end joining protein LigD